MNSIQEYISGQGKESTIPPEIKGWNWGAFFLNVIWGIGNSTYIALLTLIPFVNLVMPFVLAIKGNQWAWQNRIWEDVDHFKRTQKKWAIAGFLIVGINILLFGLLISKGLKGEVYKHSLAVIQSNSEVVRLIGEPIKAGFAMGSITNSGSEGSATLNYSLTGSKGEARAYVYACKHMHKWMFYNLEVKTKDNLEIQVIPFNQKISTYCINDQKN